MPFLFMFLLFCWALWERTKRFQERDRAAALDRRLRAVLNNEEESNPS